MRSFFVRLQLQIEADRKLARSVGFEANKILRKADEIDQELKKHSSREKKLEEQLESIRLELVEIHRKKSNLKKQRPEMYKTHKSTFLFSIGFGICFFP